MDVGCLCGNFFSDGKGSYTLLRKSVQCCDRRRGKVDTRRGAFGEYGFFRFAGDEARVSIQDTMTSSIVILTGAGISSESGIQTFRGADGLWEGHRVEDVATPEGFARDPELAKRFCSERRRHSLSGIEANAGHLALARLEKGFQGEVLLVTENVDKLHAKAGWKNIIHRHGELLKARCLDCDEEMLEENDLGMESECPRCDSQGRLRPDIVWFGEMPYQMPRIETALGNADVFLSIGTPGSVYPAAGFGQLVRDAGARTIEANLEKTAGSSSFDRCVRGKAGAVLPGLIDELLEMGS